MVTTRDGNCSLIHLRFYRDLQIFSFDSELLSPSVLEVRYSMPELVTFYILEFKVIIPWVMSVAQLVGCHCPQSNLPVILVVLTSKTLMWLPGWLVHIDLFTTHLETEWSES